MAALPRPPYPADPGTIGMSRDGRAVGLAPMAPDAAARLGPALAAINPWARVGLGGERMAAFLAQIETGASRYRIQVEGVEAGVMIVRLPWLHGPYLHLLGLLPPFQGIGVGDLALRWLEAEARGRFRNLWLCASAFNDGAQRFYAAHGFARAACLDSLVYEGVDEILMRKRLF